MRNLRVSRRLQRSLAAVAALVLVAIVARSWRVNTSIVAFLPAGDDRELFEISKALTDSTLTRRMVLSLGVPDLARAEPGDDDGAAQDPKPALARAAARLAAALDASPRVAKVRRGVDENTQETLFETYFPRRYHFWSLEPERELPRATSDDALARQAEALRDALGGPEGLFVRQLAPRDPLQRFRAFVDELEQRRPQGLELVDGQLFSRDGQAILFLELADSPFDGEKQRELLDHIARAARALPPIEGRPLVLEASGVNRFAVASETVVRRDLGRISFFSLGGLLLLFGILFGKPARLLVAFAPLGMGVLVAMAFSLVLFGELHVLTLAFGSALIGVAIDYPVHLLNHHDLATGEAPGSTLRRVRPSLLLAGATTGAGLLGLGFAGFPGLREMAVFACAGIAGALGTTLLLGGCLGQGGGATRAQRALSAGLARVLLVGRSRVRGARLILGGVVLLAAGGLTSLRWQDDLGALNLPQPELLAEDQRVQERIGEGGPRRFLVAQGMGLEEALQRHEGAVARLQGLEAAGALGGYVSVEPLLRSVSLQERNLATLREQDRLVERTLDALGAAGFVRGGFSPFAEELAGLLEGEPTGRAGAAPLTWSQLRDGPLEPLVAPFLVESLGEARRDSEGPRDTGRGAQQNSMSRAAVVTQLRDVRQPEDVRAAFADVDGVHYFDQRASLDAMSRDVRTRTTRLLLVAAVVMALVALVRYRSLGDAVRIVMPGWSSALITFGTLGGLGVELNLLHVVAVVLVLGMGIDYGIFLLDAARTDAAPAALLSILVACLSTVLSFGLLALSNMPALRAIGQTVALGVGVNAVLAPLVAIAFPASATGSVVGGRQP